MSFMTPQITTKQPWLVIETDCGIWFVPADVPNCTVEEALEAFDAENGDVIDELVTYTEGTEIIEPVEVIVGYGVRLSAVGYMDCTDWDVFTNKREAIRAAKALESDD